MAKKKKKSKARNSRPLSPRPQQVPTTSPSSSRTALESKSVGPLLFLHRLPRWLLPVLVGVCLLLGLGLPFAWAAVFLFLIGLFFTWLLVLSWPVITPTSRVFRLVVISVIFAASVAKMLGRA